MCDAFAAEDGGESVKDNLIIFFLLVPMQSERDFRFASTWPKRNKRSRICDFWL